MSLLLCGISIIFGVLLLGDSFNPYIYAISFIIFGIIEILRGRNNGHLDEVTKIEEKQQ